MVRLSSCPHEDKNRLSVHDEDSLRCDSLKLFSRAFSLTFLADDEAQGHKVFEEHKNKEIMELRQGMDHL